jgi:hypothetical protein
MSQNIKTGQVIIFINLETNNMNKSTSIEKLESLFYNEANPTINSNSWVIEEKAFRRLIEAAKAMEKEQIIEAHIQGQPIYSCQSEKAEEYYYETYGSK